MIAVAPMVFLVDDDPSVRRSLIRLLASAGYTVEAFASAKGFLVREPYAGPCCLVLDVRMPGLSGLELSAHSLHRRLEEAGKLRRDAA